jgi:hypothetical protein
MATPSDTASAALGDVDRLRNSLKKKQSLQVSSKDECDFVKATALTWFNTHRKVFDAGVGEVKAADDIFRKLLAAGDRKTSRAVYFAFLRELRPLLISLRTTVVSADAANAALVANNAPPDFSPLANAEMQAVLLGRWTECIRCVGAAAPMAATVMMGGLLETLLLARINFEANKAPVFTANSAPKDRQGKTLNLSEWGLKDFVAVCHELGWIGVSAKEVAVVLRDFRNYIHPHKQLSHGVHLKDDDAALFWDVSKTITRQLLKNCAP